MGTIRNIDIDIREKERFTINGDENKVIELNTADMSIISRYSVAIPKLNALADRMDNLAVEGDSDEDIEAFGKEFEDINNGVREVINEIFDYDICSVCAKDGSMFDLSNGEYRFIVIIDTLFSLYDKTITEESKKLQKRIKSHTAKYLPKDHQRKGK